MLLPWIRSWKSHCLGLFWLFSQLHGKRKEDQILDSMEVEFRVCCCCEMVMLLTCMLAVVMLPKYFLGNYFLSWNYHTWKQTIIIDRSVLISPSEWFAPEYIYSHSGMCETFSYFQGVTVKLILPLLLLQILRCRVGLGEIGQWWLKTSAELRTLKATLVGNISYQFVILG